MMMRTLTTAICVTLGLATMAQPNSKRPHNQMLDQAKASSGLRGPIRTQAAPGLRPCRDSPSGLPAMI